MTGQHTQFIELIIHNIWRKCRRGECQDANIRANKTCKLLLHYRANGGSNPPFRMITGVSRTLVQLSKQNHYNIALNSVRTFLYMNDYEEMKLQFYHQVDSQK